MSIRTQQQEDESAWLKTKLDAVSKEHQVNNLSKHFQQ